ncbi:hypothetical protein [Oscillatoria sp. FACHB-1406]|uniref:hypothetical protein n=1 Tax=Oscillatoria sp. FACHB-1406 TaxID=2692846 RepID=UPI0016842A19|nr:hypothetical protein [Oscillatoria sp. FACHB-1406]MBD2579919.1 hypothetical protein [Oscillatoria sp. FACHB-1406]
MKKLLTISLALTLPNFTILPAFTQSLPTPPPAPQPSGNPVPGGTHLRETAIPILREIGSDAAVEILQTISGTRSPVKKVAFSDGEWIISITENKDDLIYSEVNLKTRSSLTLRGASISTDGLHQLYHWNNGDYRYQVTWQPSEPQVIRLQVFDGSGKELLNRLLNKVISD